MSSILVRLTGIACWGYAFLIVGWFMAAASSEAAFTWYTALFHSRLGDILMFGAVWAVFYHMLGRLRHVIWDFGYCLEVSTSEKLAIAMIGLATVLSVLVVWVV